LICLAVLLGSLLQTPQIDWVVRDVVPPRDIGSNYFSTLGPTWPFGPSGQDGVTSWVMHNEFTPDIGSGRVGRLDLNYFSGIGAPAVTRVFPDTEYATNLGTWATLSTPTGTQVLLKSDFYYGLVSLDPTTGQLIGSTVMPTNLPGGAPDPQRMWNLYAAGDINGDGYDDCFWTDTVANTWVYYGLLDGATLTVPWVRSFHWVASNVVTPAFWEPDILPDLTGDGHSDFFVGRSMYNNSTGQSAHSWLLLSGVDGSIVWSQTGNDTNAVQFPYGWDLSGDGYPDAVVREGDKLRGISVRDGQELWQGSLLPLWNSGGVNEVISGDSGSGGFLFSHSLSATGHKQIVYPIYLLDLVGTANDNRSGFGHFDAIDGSFLGAFYAPRNLKPWSTDDFSRRMLIPIGDYDRDGLAEWYARDSDPANTPAWAAASNQYTERMVILGQRTLFVPETHSLGALPFPLDIAIPSAPNKDYLVLFSTVFDSTGGLVMEKWETKEALIYSLKIPFQPFSV